MPDKLKINTNGKPDDIYGPFYVMADVVVKEGVATIRLSEDARCDGHVYVLEDGNTMRMTKPDEGLVGGLVGGANNGK